MSAMKGGAGSGSPVAAAPWRRRWLASLAGPVRRLARWRRGRRELRELLRPCDMRLLRDIGIDCYDINQELRRPFWDWRRE